MRPETEAALVELAQKLGRSVEELWPAAVRYTAIEGVAAIVGALAGVAVTLHIARRNLVKVEVRSSLDDNFPFYIGWGVAWAVILGCVATALGNIGKVVEPVGYLVSNILR